jgi:hypothetical protein
MTRRDVTSAMEGKRTLRSATAAANTRIVTTRLAIA